MAKKLFILSLLFICQTTLLADFHITEHMLINNGQSNNYIRCIVQDDHGLVWIATDSGLNCFDGSEYINFNTSNSELNSNMINCLYYDRLCQLIWIGTKGDGLCVMDVDKRTISRCNMAGIAIRNVLNISHASNDGIWIVSQDQILRFDCKKKAFTSYKDFMPIGFYQCTLDDGNGHLLLGMYLKGIHMVDLKTKKNISLSGIEKHPEPHKYFNTIYKDHNGRIWIGTNFGLWYYDPIKRMLTPFVCDNGHVQGVNITSIQEVDDNKLWLATEYGISIVDLTTMSVRNISSGSETYGLVNNILTLYQDEYKNIWIGSKGEGIDFISHEKPFFHSLSKDQIWGIFKEGKQTWVGSVNQILCYENGTFMKSIDIRTPGKSGIALSINSDGKGHLLVSAYDRLLKIDKVSGKVDILRLDDGNPIAPMTFFRSSDNTLWISTTDGVITLKDGILRQETELNKILAAQRTTGIRCDKQGKIWVSTYENGIYVFDSNKRLVVHLSQEDGFFSNSIQHLYADNNNGLWLSTPDGLGYIRDMSQPEQFELYGYKQGLKDLYIRAVIEDELGNVWVSTNNGISMFDKNKQTFYNYNKSDGLPANNFTGGAVRQDDGSLYFTSLEGICVFNPKELVKEQALAPIHMIECISLGNNIEYSQDQLVSVSDDGVYHLAYDHNSFKIVFSLADYAQARQADYAYRIKGRDNSWIFIESNNITFRNMSPGHYVIEVKARLKGQDWTEKGMAVAEVIISQPFWWTWPARVLYVLMALLLLYIVFRHYQHRLKLKNELELERRKNIDEQELNNERLQFFTNITHELRTPLTLILGPLEDLKSKNNLTVEDGKKIELIRNNSLRLSNLINKLLEFRKIETHNRKLSVARDDIRRTITDIGQQFAQSNTNKDVSIVVNIPDLPILVFFDEDVVSTILNNLLNNACKYTNKGSITLSLEDIDDNLEIVVSDTGFGISKKALPHIFERYFQGNGSHQVTGTGIGLAIVKSLVELHEGEITVDSQENKGTTFRILIKKNNTYPTAIHKESVSASVSQKSHALLDTNEQSDNETRPTLLIIEDNEEIRDYIANSLKESYRIFKAENGKQGLEKAFDQMPDIIVSDIMMPVMDGLELCHRLKEDIRTCHIPIILLTAKDTMDDQQEGYEQGADSYLTKPFSIQMLRARISNLLSARRRMATWLATNTAKINLPEEEAGTKLNSIDQRFLDDMTAIIEQHISDEDISMAFIGEKLKMSHSTLYRKIKALTGLTGNEYIRKVKLRHSLQLMLNQRKNVSEAAYESGFADLSYFRSCFKAEYGMTPTEYLKMK